MTAKSKALVLALFVVFAACDDDTGVIARPSDAASGDAGTAAIDSGVDGAVATLVVLPDTQYYAHYYPSTFAAQTQWILDQRTERSIAAVAHVGDIVDDAFETKEWAVASPALHALDGKVPYLLVPGNHDLGLDRSTLMNDYFSPNAMPWITGTMTAGHSENSYALVDIGPQPWIIVGLEFGPRDAVLTWAGAVLKAYASRPAIIVTHAYLFGGDNTRYRDPAQLYYPVGFTPAEGINDGEAIWQKLVVPNGNVRVVLCGHYGIGRQSSQRPDGSVVHELLSDYQWLDGPSNGFGYLRLMQFDYGRREIRVQTYSPTLRKFLTDDPNQFTVSLEL